MNTRVKTILMAVALAAAASVQVSQAADQSAWFEQQRELTDGNFQLTPFVPTPARTKSATPHQIAESKWFDAERTREGGVAQYPFPLPDQAPVVATKSGPTMLSHKSERSADEGYDSPSQFQN